MTASLTDLKILQSKSLPKAVQDEIQRMILDGTFQAGQKLAEIGLAKRLGVSRGPVREAFRGLEEAGLIRLSKNRGVFVREINLDEAKELYEVRTGLDALAGWMLAPRITDAQIKELENLLDKMDTLLGRDDLGEYFLSNMEFHDRIVEMTGNSKLLEIYRRLANETHLTRRHSIYRGGGRQFSNQEHREIVQALATRNGDEAERAMRRHVINGRDRFVAVMLADQANDATSADAEAAEE
jgi:phosphonate utilization transcriptional regulator